MRIDANLEHNRAHLRSSAVANNRQVTYAAIFPAVEEMHCFKILENSFFRTCMKVLEFLHSPHFFFIAVEHAVLPRRAPRQEAETIVHGASPFIIQI